MAQSTYNPSRAKAGLKRYKAIEQFVELANLFPHCTVDDCRFVTVGHKRIREDALPSWELMARLPPTYGSWISSRYREMENRQQISSRKNFGRSVKADNPPDILTPDQ